MITNTISKAQMPWNFWWSLSDIVVSTGSTDGLTLLDAKAFAGKTRTTRTPVFWDTLRLPMITHTSDSHQIPSENRQSQSYKFWQIAKNSNLKFCKKLNMQHTFWSCLIRCIDMKWIEPEPYVLQSGHGMQDGRADRVKPIYPPTTSLCIW